MKVLILRNAIAVDSREWAEKGKKENQRPLTKRGEKRMRTQSKALVQLLPTIDIIAASPLVRARETAEILNERYPKAALEIWKALSPKGDSAEVLEALREFKGSKTIALVGHEPELGGLLGLMLSGKEKPVARIKKGGACLLEFVSRPKPGGAQLEWLLSPAALRMICRGKE